MSDNGNPGGPSEEPDSADTYGLGLSGVSSSCLRRTLHGFFQNGGERKAGLASLFAARLFRDNSFHVLRLVSA